MVNVQVWIDFLPMYYIFPLDSLGFYLIGVLTIEIFKTVVCLCIYYWLSLICWLFCLLGKCAVERGDREYVMGFRTNGSESSLWHFPCPNKCGRIYKYKTSMVKHFKHECGKEPKYFCRFCPKKFHQKGNLKTHIGLVHKQFF